MKERFEIQLDDYIKERVREVAFKNKMSMGSVIRICVRNELRIIEPKKEDIK